MQRRLRANALGLSEIVGSLMLVLIVVAAATAFGAFISSYQKTLQAEQATQHDRALESIKVISAATYLNSNATLPGTLLNANFTIASLDQNPIIVTGLDVDNQPVRNYTALELNLTTGTIQPIQVAALGQLDLGPNQELTLSIDATPGLNSSFYSPTYGLTDRSYLQIDMFTLLSNDFRAVFLPPTAIALVGALQSFNGSIPVTVPVLNGENSVQPGNSSIVSWDWTVVGTPFFVNGSWNGSGEIVAPSFPRASYQYDITLTVVDNFGLIGTDTIAFFDP